jgi:hypothetical protein
MLVNHPAAPAPNPNIYAITGERQELIPPSLSDLSLQSASSVASWPSPSSPSSRKHSRELPFDGSPQPKRRLLAEMNSAATTFRYSAPCVQSSLGSDGSERRGGFLRRSGAPIQSFISTAEIDGPSPSTVCYDGSSEGERAVEPRGNASLDSVYSRPQPSRMASTAPAPLEKRESRKKRGYSFWRLTSPPIVESSVAEFERRGESSSKEPPVPGQKSSARAAQTNPSRSESVVVRPSANPEPWRAGTLEHESGARLSALQALEGTHGEGGRDQKEDHGKVSHSDVENPIAMCGKRLYSDWTGHWGGSSCNPIPQPRPLLTSSLQTGSRGRFLEQVHCSQRAISLPLGPQSRGSVLYETAKPCLPRRGLWAGILV